MENSRVENVINLSVKDFQIIKNASLTFGPGLNAIIGQSNNGKSALFRAAKSCIYNEPGTTSIRNGCSSYAVGLQMNGHTVIYQKGKESIYKIDGNVFQKVGRTQLPEVAGSLNIRELNLNGSNEQLNFWDQMEKPFLLDRSETELFRFIVDSGKDNNITLALKTLVSDRQGITKEINREADATREIKLSQRRNDLEAEKAKKIKEIETYEKQQGTLKQQKSMLEKKNEDIDKKLEKIAVAISKCNLAWKSLFNNKTWEQIQAKSLDGRFTRDKAKEAELKQGAKNPVEETKGKEAVEQAVDPKEKEESSEVNPAEIKQEEIKEESEVEEPELPAKKSRFQTILSALRHPVQSVKNWMQNRKAEKSEKESKDKDPEEKKTEKKTVHSTETQRDAFLAQLQKMAEGHEKADIEASAAELQKAAAHKQERRQEDKDR